MKNKELIYGMYCRKSSESEDKQMQSIDSQIRDLEILSKKENIFVNKNYIICESQSAHTLGRDGFKRLTDAINQEKINCILTWHINRLSRNPVDGAHIIHLLDLGKLHCIKTTEKTYYNTPDDKFMLNLAFGMSKKDSDDKSILVKRGLREKAIKGYPPGVSKIGYLNDKTEDRGNRKWLKDEVRFPLVQMLFQRYLTGKYSVADIHRYATDELKLTTPVRKREGGKPVAQSYVYSMLADPIYAGFFNYQDKRYELNPNLERVISEDEYYKIQIMLGQKGKPRMRTSDREGLYNYIMKDAQGGSVTPDFKFQLICDCKQKFSYTAKSNCPSCGIKISQIKNPTYLSYVYYSSSKDRKKKGVKVKCIEEKKVDQIILEKFTNEIAISQELSDWCVRHLRLIDSKLEEDTKSIEVSQVETEEKITNQLERLLDLKTSRDNINTEELRIISTKEEKLYKELENIKNAKKGNGDSYNLEHTEKRFNLMSKILQTLENGSRNERKEILSDFGSNLTLNDGKVSIYNVKEMEVFINCLEKAKLINPRFEPKNSLADKEKTDVFTSVIPTLLRG